MHGRGPRMHPSQLEPVLGKRVFTQVSTLVRLLNTMIGETHELILRRIALTRVIPRILRIPSDRSAYSALR
jgi:hypothetical protein